MKLYFVKHIPSGHFIPRPEGKNGRGGSFLEPHSDKNRARIFYTERSAKIFISAWVKGKYVCDRYYSPGHPGNDWEDSYDEHTTIVPVASRKREDMSIIMREILL